MKRKTNLLSFQLLLLLSVLSHFDLFASTERFSKFVNVDINNAVGTTFIVRDQKWFNLSEWNKVESILNVQNSLIFSVDNSERKVADMAAEYTIFVNVDLWYADTRPENDPSYSVSQALILQFDPDTKLLSDKFTFNRYDIAGAHQMKVTVTYATTSPSTVTNHPGLRLEGEILVDRKYIFSPDNFPTVVQNGQNFNAPQQMITWELYDGAEEYDFEWAFFDLKSELIQQQLNAPNTQILNHDIYFENNATRVTVSSPDYTIQSLYPTGYIYYRIRAARINVDGLREWSKWTTSAQSFTLGTFPNKIYVWWHENKTQNYQSSVQFSENGKNMPSVNYFDNIGLSRQTVVLNNAIGKSIASNNFYDYYGRASGASLPVPTDNDFISFNPDLTLRGGVPYNKTHFADGDFLDIPLSMQNSSGAGKYYSENNPINNPRDKFIPNANGYPFTIQEYKPDGSGRIARQSGAGSAHALGSNHETKYYYGKPEQEELDKLFGNDVGFAGQYQKNMVIDANGQVSLSYIDLSGKIIATALAGIRPSNLLPLDDASGTLGPIPADLLENLSRNDLSMVASKSFLLESDGLTPFVWSVSELVYDPECSDIDLCFSCYYDLKFSVSDETGNLWNNNEPYEQNITNWSPSDPNGYLCSDVSTNGDSEAGSFSLPLKQGSYNVSWELTLSESAIDDFEKYFIENQTCINYDSILQVQYSQIDSSCYAPSCQECLDNLPSEQMFIDSLNAFNMASGAGFTSAEILMMYNQEVSYCDLLCDTVYSKCEAYLDLLIADVSPGGQYAFFEIADTGLVFPNDPTSIFYNNQYTFSNDPSIIYTNENGIPDTVFNFEGNYVLPSELTRDEFIQKFKRSWADTLVVYFHPEYCVYLEFCDNDQFNDSDQFDTDLLGFECFQEAVEAGFANGTGIVNDPFFLLGGAGVGCADQMDSLLNGFIYNNQFDPIITTITTMVYGSCSDTIGTGNKYADNLAWEYYLAMYNGFKNQLIGEKISNYTCGNADCVENPDPCSLSPNIYANKIRRIKIDGYLDQTISGIDDLQVWIDLAQDSLEATCNTNCNLQVETWLTELNECQIDNLSLAAMQELRNRLINVCLAGCDGNKPFGSSSTRPGTYGLGMDSTFAQIIFDIIPLADTCSIDCGPFTITSIRPYETPEISDYRVVNSLYNTCVCENLEELEQCYIADTSGNYVSFAHYLAPLSGSMLNDAQVDSLKSYCSAGNIYIPKTAIPNYLDCNVCKDCNEIQAIVDEFELICDPLDTLLAGSYTELLTVYINQQTGFYQSVTAIEDFLKNCLNNNNYCSPTLVLCPTSGDADLWEDQNNCLASQEEQAEIIANHIYQQKIDSLREAFRFGYKETCLTKDNQTFSAELANNAYYYTLYYYDQAGNLVQTVAPNGVIPIDDQTKLDDVQLYREQYLANSNTVTQPTFPQHNFLTQYKFNGLNQIIEQISPDSEVSKFWYDKLGRQILSQDGRQRDINAHTYSIFDALGRVIEIGEIIGDLPVNLINELGIDYANFEYWVINNPNKRDVTHTFYESSPYNIPEFGAEGQTNLRTRISAITRENVYDNYLYSYDYASHFSYDVSGNVKTVVQEIAGLSYGHQFKRIDYEFDYISGNVNAVFYQKGKVDQFTHYYIYDENNRLIEVKTSAIETDPKALLWEDEARYEYYDHGPLARTVYGDEGVQGIDYAYTIQGWVKGNNSTQLSPERDMGRDGLVDPNNENELVARDALAYTLNYFENDYKQVDPSNPMQGSIPLNSNLSVAQHNLYNGNINSMTIHNKGLDSGPMAYAYRYDQLHRIKTMQSFDNFIIGQNKWGIDNNLTSFFTTSYSYDANGNLQTLKRNAPNYNNTQSILQDDLNYNYRPETNLLEGYTESADVCEDIIIIDFPVNESIIYQSKLETNGSSEVNGNKNVVYQSDGEVNLLPGFEISATAGEFEAKIEPCTSNGPGQDGSFVYDAAGNIIVNEDGANIEWDVFGKVKRVTNLGSNGGDYVEYGYDPFGNRTLKKIYKALSGRTYSTYYFRDPQQNVMAVYESAGMGIDWKEQHIYGSTRLGQLQNLKTNISGSNIPLFENSKDWQLGRKVFELSNHLGNVLATVNDRKKPEDLDLNHIAEYYEPTIISASDYYPFGLQMEGRTLESESYRYGFNGKEKDESGEWGDLTHYDYGFRIYNPGLGRFLSVDPLTKSYPWYTPYQFAGNKPTRFIDLDGKEEWDLMLEEYIDNKYGGTYQHVIDNIYLYSRVENGITKFWLNNSESGQFQRFYSKKTEELQFSSIQENTGYGLSIDKSLLGESQWTNDMKNVFAGFSFFGFTPAVFAFGSSTAIGSTAKSVIGYYARFSFARATGESAFDIVSGLTLNSAIQLDNVILNYVVAPIPNKYTRDLVKNSFGNIFDVSLKDLNGSENAGGLGIEFGVNTVDVIVFNTVRSLGLTAIFGNNIGKDFQGNTMESLFEKAAANLTLSKTLEKLLDYNLRNAFEKSNKDN